MRNREGGGIPHDQAPNANTEDSLVPILLAEVRQHRLGLEAVDAKDAIEAFEETGRELHVGTHMDFAVDKKGHLTYEISRLLVHHPAVLGVGSRGHVVGGERREVAHAGLVLGGGVQVAGDGGAEGGGGAVLAVLVEDAARLFG